MNLAHVIDGFVRAYYRKGSEPTSFKGKLLPVVEDEKPENKPGSKWVEVPSIFDDRVELRWEEQPLSIDEQDAIATAEENDRIRSLIGELRTGQGTAAERLIRLERVVSHLVKLSIDA